MNTTQADNEVVLGGCAPTPLASYLKALGVMRLLAEQKPEWEVRGAWRGEHFVIKSPAFAGEEFAGEEDAREKVSEFFLREYSPTAMVAPWNGGSGFYPKDTKVGIEPIIQGRSERFSTYRDVIGFCQHLVEEQGLKESPKGDDKSRFLTTARSRGPEALLDWMDAAILLAGEDPKYPPLLGTGGNDGRLDFTNNFMQRLGQLIDPEGGEPTDSAAMWLPAALFGDSSTGMENAAVGQFNPGDAGGANAGNGFESGSLINPWGFVLMLEGALFFAATATRRLESADPGALAYPFTVRASAAGSGAVGCSDEGQARAEIWLPLWDGFSSASEVKNLLAEGRATLNRRSVRDGLGFARAVAGLGVDRGISHFQRYAFLMRAGKAYFATPLSRFQVSANPDVELINELEKGQFLDRLRRFARGDHAPASIQSLSRQLEDGLFGLAQRADAQTLQKVLGCLGALSTALAKSRAAREFVPPVPVLSEQWALKADDGTPEYRIAVALAGLGGTRFPMRPYMVPVRREKYGWSWHDESRSAVWGEGGFADNLARVLGRRRLDEEKDETLDGHAFRYAFGAEARDVEAWLDGGLDEQRLARLLLGLVNVRIPKNLPAAAPRMEEGDERRVALPAPFAALKPFFMPAGLLEVFKLLDEHRSLPSFAEILTALQTNRTQRAVDLAWGRLRAVGYPLPAHPRQAPRVSGTNGVRLLAALAIPLDAADAAPCLRSITSVRTTKDIA